VADDPDIQRLLKARDPAPGGVAITNSLDDALDDLGASLTSVPRSEPRRRSARRWRIAPRNLLLTGAILAVVAGGATAAGLLGTYTGRYAKGREIKLGGPGEYLRQGGTGFCQAALRLSSDLQYPSGYADWRLWVLVVEADVKHVTTSPTCDSPGGSIEVPSGAVHGYFAMSSFCAWVYDWRHAKLTGNDGEAERAAEVIDAATRWKAVIAEDPHPSAGPLHRERFGLRFGLGGGHSLFGWFLPFRSAVLNGDVTRVGELIASGYGTAGCSTFNPPSASHGGTTRTALTPPS
jgi:hypothetical protein